MEKPDIESLVAQIEIDWWSYEKNSNIKVLCESSIRKLEDSGDVKVILPLLNSFSSSVRRRNPDETIARACAISAVSTLSSLPALKALQKNDIHTIIEGLVDIYPETHDSHRVIIFYTLKSIVESVPVDDNLLLKIESVFSDWRKREDVITEKNKYELLPGTNDW